MVAGLDYDFHEKENTLRTEFSGFEDLSDVLASSGLGWFPLMYASEQKESFLASRLAPSEAAASCLLYVAMTRARDRLILALPNPPKKMPDHPKSLGQLLIERTGLSPSTDGRGNRVFAHVNLALKLEDDEDEVAVKNDRIKQIRSAGLEVIHVIHRHEIPADAVSEVEAALIDAYPGLSNVQGGIASGVRGPMNAAQIVDLYDLPELEFAPLDKLVLINVNSL